MTGTWFGYFFMKNHETLPCTWFGELFGPKCHPNNDRLMVWLLFGCRLYAGRPLLRLARTLASHLDPPWDPGILGSWDRGRLCVSNIRPPKTTKPSACHCLDDIWDPKAHQTMCRAAFRDFQQKKLTKPCACHRLGNFRGAKHAQTLTGTLFG